MSVGGERRESQRDVTEQYIVICIICILPLIRNHASYGKHCPDIFYVKQCRPIAIIVNTVGAQQSSLPRSR